MWRDDNIPVQIYQVTGRGAEVAGGRREKENNYIKHSFHLNLIMFQLNKIYTTAIDID